MTSASDIWGIVGDGTFNGWGGPNVKMVPDPCNDGVFLAYGVSLTQAQMKFRLNDDWGETPLNLTATPMIALISAKLDTRIPTMTVSQVRLFP